VNTLPVAPSLNCLIFLFPHRIHALLLCLISPPLLNALLGFPSFFQLDCTEYVLFFVKTLANFENEFPFLQKSYMTETESWKRRFDSVFEKKNRERIQVVPGTYTSKAQETNDKEWLNVRKSSPYEEEKKDSKSVVPTLSEEDEQELANLVLIPLRRSRKKRFASIMNKSSSYFRLAAPITCETTSPMPTPEEYNA